VLCRIEGLAFLKNENLGNRIVADHCVEETPCRYRGAEGTRYAEYEISILAWDTSPRGKPVRVYCSTGDGNCPVGQSGRLGTMRLAG